MGRTEIAELHAEGLSAAEIARRLDVTPPTVCYHLRRLGVESDARFSRRYDWVEIQRYYDLGHSITECQERFGFARETWNSARRRGVVAARPQAMPIAQLLAGKRNRVHLRLRLVAAGLKEPRCELCGIDSWRGAPLSLALHHINGIGDDNRVLISGRMRHRHVSGGVRALQTCRRRARSLVSGLERRG